jgi:hypothetical protein
MFDHIIVVATSVFYGMALIPLYRRSNFVYFIELLVIMVSSILKHSIDCGFISKSHLDIRVFGCVDFVVGIHGVYMGILYAGNYTFTQDIGLRIITFLYAIFIYWYTKTLPLQLSYFFVGCMMIFCFKVDGFMSKMSRTHILYVLLASVICVGFLIGSYWDKNNQILHSGWHIGSAFAGLIVIINTPTHGGDYDDDETIQYDELV